MKQDVSQEIPQTEPRIEVCHGPKCSDFGSRELSKELGTLGIECSVGDCRSQCPHAPVAFIDGRMLTRATIEKLTEQVTSGTEKQR